MDASHHYNERESTMYIGAGTVILILAVIIVVMMMRRGRV